MAKHLYRKQVEHAFEAEETARGFHRLPDIDRLGTVDAYHREEDGKFFVYVALEGEVDPDEVLAAAGYERVV